MTFFVVFATVLALMGWITAVVGFFRLRELESQVTDLESGLESVEMRLDANDLDLQEASRVLVTHETGMKGLSGRISNLDSRTGRVG